MIRLRQIRLSRSGRMLLDGASADIALGECVALVGRNGCGKSTLLAALRDEVALDGGSIEVPPLRVAVLQQQAPSGTESALDYATGGDARAARALSRAAHAERDDDHETAAAAHIELDEIGGYDAPARAARILAGLGFDAQQARSPVNALSGGWRMRLNLARVMMSGADVLLLDEPTNHLDLDAVLWVEQWLRGFDGTVLLVSHDREFLDAVADRVLHFDHGQLRAYSGGYSAFEAQRAAAIEQLERQADSQARRIAELERFIERFRAKATKARQAQSRVKALERIARITRPVAEQDTSFRFFDVGQGPDPMIVAEALALGYGGDPVLRDVALTIRRGTRLGVLGRNGEGKSTLVKALAAALAPSAGTLHRSPSLRVGYLAQSATDELDGAMSPLALAARIAPDAPEQALRDYLASYGFRGEQALLPCGPFSGGEKARLALALLAWRRPQLLILDEPTNHLDAQARDALAEALGAFDGALVLVSHDRHLLRVTVDAFVIVHDGSVEPFDDDLEGYRRWLLARRGARTRAVPNGHPGPAPAPARTPGASSAVAPGATPGANGGAGDGPAGDAAGREPRQSRRELRAQAAREREQRGRLRRPLQEQVRGIERALEPLEARRAELDALLADPAAYVGGTDMGAIAREHGELCTRIRTLEEQWLTLSASIDRLSDES